MSAEDTRTHTQEGTLDVQQGDAIYTQEGIPDTSQGVEEQMQTRKLVTLSERAQDMYEETVKEYSSKLIKIRCDIDRVVNTFESEHKSMEMISSCKHDLCDLSSKYDSKCDEFFDYLFRKHTSDSQRQLASQKLIHQNVELQVNSTLKLFDYALYILEQESKTLSVSKLSVGKKSRSRSSSSKSTSSSASSILLKQRTKAEVAKKCLEFAEMEAQMEKNKAELVRKQSDLKVDMDLLTKQREAAVAETELKVVREELDCVESSESDSELHTSFIDNSERTKQYIMDQNSVVKPDTVVKSENVSFAQDPVLDFVSNEQKKTLNPKTLNPHASPFEVTSRRGNIINRPNVDIDSYPISSVVGNLDTHFASPIVCTPVVNKSTQSHIKTQPVTSVSDRHVGVTGTYHTAADIDNTGLLGANSSTHIANELTKFLLKKDLLMTCFSNYNDQPETFPIWKTSFLSLKRELGVSSREELDLLIKYLGPESSKFALSLRVANANYPERALGRIWDRLEERFGRPEMVESALKRKLDRFPKFTNREYSKLYELSDLLSEIECVKEDPRYSTLLAYFDASSGVKQIVEKLPFNLQSKWTDRAIKYKNAHNVSFPPFTFLVQYVREMSTQFNDPGFTPTEYREPQFRKRSSRPGSAVFAKKTEVTRPTLAEDKRKRCPLHNLNHSLNDCKAFRQKSLGERKRFLKDKNICFRCCATDVHVFRDCKASVKCSECGSSQHPSAMHLSRVNSQHLGSIRAPESSQHTSSMYVTSSSQHASSLQAPMSSQHTTDASSTPAPAPPHGGENNTGSVSAKCLNVCGQGFMGRSCSKTILVKVYPTDKPEAHIKLYALIDDQSNQTLGRPELFDKLNVSEANARHYTLTSCSGNVTAYGRYAKGYTVESLDGSAKMDLPSIIECCAIPDVRSEIPTPEITDYYEHLRGIPIPPLDSDVSILLLIGRDLPEAHHVHEQRTGPKNSPFAQHLNLGWVIVGDVCLGKTHKPDDSVNVYKTCVLSNGRPTTFKECENNFLVKEDTLDRDDGLGASVFQKSRSDDKVGLSIEDQRFVEVMNTDFAKGDNGHYTAPLPFRVERPRLPNNRSQALKRAHILDNSLRKDLMRREHFMTFMKLILENGHAEEAPPLLDNEERWYLPLFGVYHPKKKDKIRVVFDSSATHNGVSLNNVLMSGPDLTNNLVGVLLRFRKEPVAVIADIEQMFYGFYVTPEHRNFLRFFWYRNNDFEDELIEYRMCVHVFGNCPSPAIASYGLRRCVNDEEKYGSDVKDFVQNNFYVDDGLASFPTASEAIDVMTRTQEALAIEGKLRLHKIASNDKTVMAAFPSSDLAKDLIDLEFDSNELPMQHSLGLCWNLNLDSFSYKISDAEKPITRRGVLSTVNSLFDPLGFIAPVVVQGRILMRDLTSETSDWDAPLPNESHSKWLEWTSSLKILEAINVPRTYVPDSLSSCVSVQLHVFSDASEKAIAAVAYLRTVNDVGQVSVGFVLGKSKLAPKHGHTIPRLELCAAVLAVEVADIVSEQLGIAPESIRYYIDSKVVLGYLQNEVRRFFVYVSNRVAKIRKFSKPDQWSYVPTEINPADCGTRPVPALEFQNCAWLQGPSFLRCASDSSQAEKFPLIDPDSDVELRPNIDVCKTSVVSENWLGTKRFERFSTWRKLVNVITRLRHIASSFHGTHSECQGWHICNSTSVERFRETEQFIIKEVQHECYSKEVEALNKGVRLPRNSNILSLAPFLDEDSILRVGGRLKVANLPVNEKTPILIPGHHHIAILLTRHFHQSVQHQGRHITEGAIRSSGYWITGGRRLISSLLFKCIKCRKLRGRLSEQKMSNLPVDRVNPSPPFTFVGVDVFGPWNVVTRKTRGGSANSKRWAVLFTCLSCRAVHIEVIEEMSSSSFINALRRFYALRGAVQEFRSDRGSNFVGAVDDLRIDSVNVENGPVAKLLYDSGTIWKFNPPHASHMGGSWERLIGVARRILDAMLLDSKYKYLTHEVLVTFMAEVTAIINNRPLVPVSSDSESPFVLTPAILLTNKTANVANNFQLGEKDMYKTQWKYVQVLAEVFWNRWRQEYLPRLQARQKWFHTAPKICVGDVILLRDKDVVRNFWPIGTVLRVFPGEDNLVRKVEVCVIKDGNRTKYVRPITEIVKLMSE